MLDPVAALDGRRRVRRGPGVLPVPVAGARNLELLATLDGGDGGRIDEVARRGRPGRPRRRPRARLLPRHAPAARARRGAPAVGRGCSCSTSPRPGSTRPGCATCARSSRRLAGEGITVLLSSHLMGEVEALCNRVAILQRRAGSATRATLAELLARSDGRYRLEATDPGARSRRLPGHRGHPRRHLADGLGSVRGRRDAAPRRSRSRSPRPGSASTRSCPAGGLEELFFDLTEPAARHDRAGLRMGAAQARGAAADVPRPGRRRRSRRCVLVVAIEVHAARRRPTRASPFFLRFAVESGLRRAASDAALRGALPVPARDGARRRRHRRGRGSQPHAEDDPHPLGTSRSAIFAAKVVAAFAYVLAAVVVDGRRRHVAGGVASGFDPLPTFSTVISPSRALALVVGSFAVYAMPVLALAAIGILLSTVSRNSAAAVVGTLLVALLEQLTQIVPVLDSARRPAVDADGPARRLGDALPHAARLGPDRPRRLRVSWCMPCRRWSSRGHTSCAAT